MKEVSLLSYLHENYKWVNYFGYAVLVSLGDIEYGTVSCDENGNITINIPYPYDRHGNKNAGKITDEEGNDIKIKDPIFQLSRDIKLLDIIPDHEVYKYKQL